MSTNKQSKPNVQDYMPAAEEVIKELSRAQSMDDFFGKEGIFARLFAQTLEAEMTEHLVGIRVFHPLPVIREEHPMVPGVLTCCASGFSRV